MTRPSTLPSLLGILLTTAVATSGLTAQAPPSAQEIVNRASAAAYYQGRDGRAHVSMTITDTQGRERSRELTILRRDIDADNGDQRFYVLFDRPADVSRTALLVWKHVDRADDRWLYLPALDLVRRIAASDERTSFVGSHFFYEDVSGRSPTEDQHTLAEETGDAYVVDSTPTDPAGVEFTRYRSYIDKTTFVPMKMEFFDAQGTGYRTYTVLEVDTIQGHPTVVESSMEDMRLGGRSVVRFDDVRYDLDLPDDIFTERYLRTPPRRYLR